MSLVQSKIYVALVKMGSCTAREVTEVVNFNRVDVYRALKYLNKKDLVEVSIGTPSVYTATAPKVAIELLISEKENRLDRLRERADSLGSWLSSIKDSESVGAQDRESSDYVAKFRVQRARQTINHYRELLARCRKEILLSWSSFGLQAHYRFGIIDFLKDCSERGVRIQGIVESNLGEKDDLLSSYDFIDFRFLEAPITKLRYMIIDNTDLTIAINEAPCDMESFACLSTNNRTLIKGFETDFLNAWNLARKSNMSGAQLKSPA